METVRTLIQVAYQRDLLLNQMDVNSAFLHAPIEEEMYVNQTPGYESSKPNQVWKLRKSLFRLKQSGRNWNTTLHHHRTMDLFSQKLTHAFLPNHSRMKLFIF